MGGTGSRAWGKYALGVAAMLTVGCMGNQGGADAAAPITLLSASASPTPSPSPSTSSPSPSPSPSRSIDPGTLPQTHVVPRTNVPMFQAEVQDLWQAIVTGNPDAALPFFFPESAYFQVKAISNPAADYKTRLIALYRLDIEAAHALLGSHAASARFVSVTVPTSQAVWIVPG